MQKEQFLIFRISFPGLLPYTIPMSGNRKKILLCGFLFALLAVTGCGQEADKKVHIESSTKKTEKEPAYEELTDIHNKSGNSFTCSYEGVKHDFLVFLPDRTGGAPFVLMLHGYGESSESFCNKTHFEEEACKRGFGVIYVDGAPDPNDATSASGWNSGIGREGNHDTAFLCSLADYLEKEYSFSKDNAYAVGFSNGAFMTHRLAMEAADVFSGVVSVAGKMPEKIWNNRNSENHISFFQITGEKDDVVPKNSDGSAKYSSDPAIEDVMDYWVSSNGLKENREEVIGKGSVLTEYSGNREAVWNLLVKDGRHSWPEESICGFDTNSLILDFLENRCFDE